MRAKKKNTLKTGGGGGDLFAVGGEVPLVLGVGETIRGSLIQEVPFVFAPLPSKRHFKEKVYKMTLSLSCLATLNFKLKLTFKRKLKVQKNASPYKPAGAGVTLGSNSRNRFGFLHYLK